jgi:glucokinase
VGLAIGVDLGGTKIAAGVVDETGNVVAQDRRPTPSLSADDVVDSMVDIINSLARGREVVGVCVAVPGFVDATRSRLLFTPNLPMQEEPLRSRIESRVHLPVVIENDANAATWGEVRYGVARNARNAVMLTVGTGLGGGLVIDGRLVRGFTGVAAEVGHMTYVQDGAPCGCGLNGCWEQYASGNALLRIARERAASRRSDAAILLSLGDGTPEGIQGEHITTAAQKGCPVAIEAFNELGDNLGRGMASLSALLDPEIFIIGGGVSVAGDLLVKPASEAFEKHLTARKFRILPKIVAASMGNEAGLIGAADLARNI